MLLLLRHLTFVETDAISLFGNDASFEPLLTISSRSNEAANVDEVVADRASTAALDSDGLSIVSESAEVADFFISELPPSVDGIAVLRDFPPSVDGIAIAVLRDLPGSSRAARGPHMPSDQGSTLLSMPSTSSASAAG